MSTREARNRANKKYLKKAYKAYVFRLRKEEDKDLIDKLEQQENKQKFIKDTIRKA